VQFEVSAIAVEKYLQLRR